MKLKNHFRGKLWSFLKEKNNNDTSYYFTEVPPAGRGAFWKEYGIVVAFLAVALLLMLASILSYGQAPVAAGNAVPDVTVRGVSNYPDTAFKLSRFRGKVLILDFWATWCAPCVGMIPRMDSLQKEFQGRIQFLPVAYQPAAVVRSFMQRLEQQQGRSYSLPEVTGDTVLSRLFPHEEYPHYVWIGADGRLAAVTEFGAVTGDNIRALLKTGRFAYSLKEDLPPLPYDYHRPLLLGGNGGNGDNLICHSVLTSYTPGLHTGLVILNDSSGKKITCKNYSIHQLFELAYSDSGRNFNRQNTRYQVADTTRIINLKASGQAYRNWLAAGNGFCYELMVPPAMKNAALAMMRQDLDRYLLNYRAAVSHRKKRCLILAGRGTAALESKGGAPDIRFDRFGWQVTNCSLALLAERLNYQQFFALPVVDESGLAGPVDLSIALPQVNGGQPDIGALNRALAPYGLQLRAEERTIEELVITDRKP